MHDTLRMLSDRLCKDIEDSSHEEKLTPATLEMLDKAVDIIKDIKTIEAMEEYDYSEGSSYARRDRMGRYSRGSDYSRNSYGDDMMRRMDDRRIDDRYMR